jgi:hypothetical protein
MKTFSLVLTAVFFGVSNSGMAQNFRDADPDANSAIGQPIGELTRPLKVSGTFPEQATVISSQNALTLESKLPKSAPSAGVLDSTIHRIQVSSQADQGSLDPHLGQDLAVVSAAYRQTGEPGSDCQQIVLSMTQRIDADASDLLEIVEKEVAANPACACEIVKAAIQSSDAEIESVVAIVETAIQAAPESMRLISQCAIAAVPESLGAVQSLLARYDSNSGDSGDSAKGSKSAKSPKGEVLSIQKPEEIREVAAMPNPLDFPGSGPVGPTNGGPGGQPVLPIIPPVVQPPPVTSVNP